jgi:uncharacterized HAD superfamily protein
MPPPGTIYVDMDDVLCETARALLAIAEREFGKTIHYDQLNTFEVGEACGLESREIAELFRIAHHPDELLGMAPIEEAAAVLRQWADAGHEIAIVTGRPPTTYEASVEWLHRHRLPYHTVLMVDKYGRFATEDTTAISLAELATKQFFFAVEDSPTMAKFLAEEMKIPVALLDRPWNRTAGEHSLINRYSHWHEIAQALPAQSKK